jgi:hypothetical protein
MHATCPTHLILLDLITLIILHIQMLLRNIAQLLFFMSVKNHLVMFMNAAEQTFVQQIIIIIIYFFLFFYFSQWLDSPLGA